MLFNQEQALTGSVAPTSTFGNTGVSRSWTLSSVDSVPVPVDQYPSMADHNTSGSCEAELTGVETPPPSVVHTAR